MTDPASSWHLDKRVPLALIVAILLQTAVFAASYGGLVSRVDSLERAVLAGSSNTERLARIEATMAGIDRRLERMEERR